MDCFHQPLIQVRIRFFFPTNDNQDGRQNGRRLCEHCRGHSNSVISYRISSKFHTWIAFIKLWFRFEYGFCLINDNQDGRQNGRRLSVSAVVVTLT